jgi:hypothetical protein
MRYDPKRRKYVVRWRQDGRQPVRRFDTAEEAEAFERTLAEPARAPEEPQNPEVAALAARAPAQVDADAPGDGVFAYKTTAGTRYGF